MPQFVIANGKTSYMEDVPELQVCRGTPMFTPTHFNKDFNIEKLVTDLNNQYHFEFANDTEFRIDDSTEMLDRTQYGYILKDVESSRDFMYNKHKVTMECGKAHQFLMFHIMKAQFPEEMFVNNIIKSIGVGFSDGSIPLNPVFTYLLGQSKATDTIQPSSICYIRGCGYFMDRYFHEKDYADFTLSYQGENAFYIGDDKYICYLRQRDFKTARFEIKSLKAITDALHERGVIEFKAKAREHLKQKINKRMQKITMNAKVYDAFTPIGIIAHSQILFPTS